MGKTSRLEAKNAGVGQQAPAHVNDVPSAAAAPSAPVERETPSKPAQRTVGSSSGTRTPKNYYNKEVHDKVIKSFLENEGELVSRLKDSFGYDVVERIIKPFQEKGTFDAYMRFNDLIFNRYLLIGNAFITLGNKKDESGKLHRTILSIDNVEYCPPKKDKETDQIIEAGHYVPATLQTILRRLKDYKVPEKHWNEFLQNGFIDGPITSRKFLSQKAEKLKEEGKFVDAAIEDLRYYNGVFIICAAPNGIPIPIDAGKALDKALERMEKFNEKSYTVKDKGFTYEVSEKEIRNLYSNHTVTITGKNDKGEVNRAEIHYDGARNRIVPLSFISGRKALKDANYTYNMEENKEAAASAQQQAEAEQAEGINKS